MLITFLLLASSLYTASPLTFPSHVSLLPLTLTLTSLLSRLIWFNP
jgi:hypothetical protein